MFGIVVVTHGKLAEAFVQVTEHVVGKQSHLLAVGIEPDDDAEIARDRIVSAIKSVSTGDGAVVLTDMFGGTPSNLAISVMQHDDLEVIAGVNLPMMIKLTSERSKTDMKQAAVLAQDAARKYINVAGNLLERKS